MTPEEELLADLKMYDRASVKDKTRVRDPEFQPEKRTPEIGPVDPDLELEEPGYRIPWSGEIDENKKVLGNAKETAKLALGDFSDTYLPEEAKIIGDYASMIDPSMLVGKKGLKVLGAASLFASPAAEHKWAVKTFKDPTAIEAYERLSNLEREQLSKAIVDAQNLHDLKIQFRKPTQSEYGHINGGPDWHEMRIPNQGNYHIGATLTHEGEHGVERMAKEYSNDDYIKHIESNPVMQKLQQELTDFYNKNGGIFGNEFDEIVDRVFEDTKYGKILQESGLDRSQAKQFLSAHIGRFPTPKGKTWNDIVETSHKKGYNAQFQNSLNGYWDAATGEGKAYHNAMMSSPNTGRWAMANGFGNEGTYAKGITMKDDAYYDMYRPELNKLRKTDTEVGLLGEREQPKVKFGGSKYQKFLEENADKVDPRGLLTGWENPKLNNRGFANAVNDARVGDRYSVGLFDDNGVWKDGGIELYKMTMDDALSTRVPRRAQFEAEQKKWMQEKPRGTRPQMDFDERPYTKTPQEMTEEYRSEVDNANRRRERWGDKPLTDEEKRAIMEEHVYKNAGERQRYLETNRSDMRQDAFKNQAKRDSLDRVIGHRFGKYLHDYEVPKK